MKEDNEIRQLIDELNYYTKKYDEGNPEISDEQWDNKYFKLVNLENKYHKYYEDSPTQRINYQVINKLNKVKHNHLMLSLDKTKSIDEIKSFIGDKSCVAMAKMDGLTCSLRYLNGRLVSAETRGNGIEGEDILHNALQVKNIPKKIPLKKEAIIDGEIICTYNDFKYYSTEYKNPRNFASGSIRLLDSQESAMRKLSFIAWDCIKGLDDFKTLSEKLEYLKTQLNFVTVPNIECSFNIEKTIDKIKLDAKNLSYPIDGIVFKYNNCEEYSKAGKTDHHFKGGIAFKFYDEEYETTLQNIEWTMGRSGILTPVAIFNTVEIEDTEVSRASLHNLTIAREILHGNKSNLGWKNQKIFVIKSNQIIPQVSQAEEVKEEGKKDYLTYPASCPYCGHSTKIKKDNDSEFLICDNPQCQGKLINRLDYFCGTRGLDIKGLSKATLEKLIDWGWVSNYVDIYKLENFSKEWINKPGFGEKSVERILKAINNSKNTTLNKVIAAAGIPLIGPRVAEQLCQYITSYQDFRDKINECFDFSTYDGFGEIMSESLLKYNYKDLDDVVNFALKINDDKKEHISNNKEVLKDLTFCITGKVHLYKNRKEIKEAIEKNGGRVVDSISSKVNYLVNNDIDSTSSKNVSAKRMNIPIITEEELQSMFV